MDFIAMPIEAVRDFLELGGDVLGLIAITIFAMWVLIVERLIFFRTTLTTLGNELREEWRARPDRKSWGAHQIREAMISRYSMSANFWVPVIQTLVALCPLLGLMGTVTGMIEVFDVMAISGTGNARSMASGVSKATIPTMAGMVGALSGVFLITIITRLIETRIEGLEEDLEIDH
ncbi:MAG: biopolymer transporter ExbB [Chromatiales bacterium]|jgi:biopolymer transport protein ExbB|nr:biopolymer transporter ExbB [Chromatiales bacterium]MDP6149904.1 MotA/TolQ/ExbB proton channel family protein [Gammaproteobacteria bacterium]MDP7269792.1 MotA/TolQ/ExbB proton channel family protein [Gammaproteobacteria bacterium]HJP04665.1 MotA/TolQ/ExbB proton channel family protein [Gammaproteobacteria bacterium]